MDRSSSGFGGNVAKKQKLETTILERGVAPNINKQSTSSSAAFDPGSSFLYTALPRSVTNGPLKTQIQQVTKQKMNTLHLFFK